MSIRFDLNGAVLLMAPPKHYAMKQLLFAKDLAEWLDRGVFVLIEKPERAPDAEEG